MHWLINWFVIVLLPAPGGPVIPIRIELNVCWCNSDLIFFGRSFYTVSFTEGNSLHTLEITSKATLVELASRYDLVNFVKNDNNIIYRIANSNKKEIMDVAASLENNDQVLSIVFNSA